MLTALAPTFESLLGLARVEAASGVAAGEADASSRLAQAHAEASALLAQARADGRAAAELAAAAAVVAAGREGRESILGAQRRAYEALRRGVCDELARDAGSGAGAAMLARLEALARARLGPEATIRRLDDGRIGVLGTDGKRSLELLADRFVERELALLGDGLAALWR